MNKETDQSYGAWIRERRISRGLSVKQVSVETRIDEQHLRALEAGNIALLPEPYIRAFLKTYASHLGLDQGEAMQRFEAFLKDQSDRLEKVRGSMKDREGKRKHNGAAITSDVGQALSESSKDVETKREFSKRSGMLLAAAVIVAFTAIVYLAIYSTGSIERSESTPAIEQATTGTGRESIPQQPSAMDEEEIVPVRQLPLPPVEQQLETNLLIAEALEETWIEARVDGRLTVSRIVPVGNTLTLIFADTLELHLGKNRGMRLILNGEELTDLGPPGMVLHLLVTQEGIAERRLTYPTETIPSILNIPPHL